MYFGTYLPNRRLTIADMCFLGIVNTGGSCKALATDSIPFVHSICSVPIRLQRMAAVHLVYCKVLDNVFEEIISGIKPQCFLASC